MLRRPVIGIAIVVTVIGVGLIGWRYFYRALPDLGYQTVPADKGRITAKVTATGTLSALVTVQVGSQVSGRIQQILVDFNSQVKKGDVLAKIDTQIFDASLEQARANLNVAEGGVSKAVAQLHDAERQFQRAQQLHQQAVLSQAEFDTTKTNLESAQAQIQVAEGTRDQARASLHQAEVNLAFTTIISPIDGIVLSRAIDVGQTVAASLQSPVLFTLAEDMRKMQVDTSVSEADVGKLHPDMMATFTVDAYPAQRFHGKVRQIRNAAQIVQSVVTYDSVIDVDNPEFYLKPGMTANVTFIYAEKDDVLRVPNAALRFRPPQEMAGKPVILPNASSEGSGKWTRASRGPNDQRTIWILDNSVAKPIDIRTGITDGVMTEVLEGDIAPGAALIIDVTHPPGAGNGVSPAGGASGAANQFRRPF